MENTVPVIRSIDGDQKKVSVPVSLMIFVVVIVVGAAIGYLTSSLKTKGTTSTKETSTTSTTTDTGKSAGIDDKKTFKDSAEGLLKEGGIDGEGNFHLERAGGESQNVYLTSSTVDLSPYVGKKVRVQGATFKGEKAGWLMDVGLIEELKQ